MFLGEYLDELIIFNLIKCFKIDVSIILGNIEEFMIKDIGYLVVWFLGNIVEI